MADIKISALPGASTLTGAESIPVVQSGVTKKVTTDQFLTKDASGNVGLGVIPSSWDGPGWMQVANGVMSKSSVTYTGANAYANGGWKYASSGAATLNIEVNGERQWFTAPSGTAGNAISFTQAMTLDSSGNLLVGTTSALNGSKATISSTSGTARVAIQSQFGSGGDASLYLECAGVNSGEIRYSRTTAHIEFVNNGVSGVRIDTSGNLLVGTITASTSDASDGLVCSNIGGYVISRRSSGPAQTHLQFVNGGATVGSISSSTTTTTYVTSSDARLKENISNADNGSALIDSLQVRQFDWKSDGSHQRYGFVAQELDAVYPEAVSKPADPDEMMGVDYSKLVPLLVQEIKSLRARVAALETV